MKLRQSMKIILLLLITNLSLSACSDDDSPQPGCFQEDNRKIVATINNASGTIRGQGNSFCSDEYIIEPDDKVESRPLGAFFPCNLTEEFQIDEAKVMFSGYVYESFDTEDICADFFEIKEIRLSNP